MGGLGAVLEPAVVIGLLFGGTWINRNKNYNFAWRERSWKHASKLVIDEESIPGSPGSWTIDDALLQDKPDSDLLSPTDRHAKWRMRELRLLGFTKTVRTPNSKVFEDTRLSRIVRKLPFMQEVWYWGLIYWVYQLGRAFTAVTLVEGTVHVARKHALQVIHLEQSLHIFRELPIQHFFLQHPFAMIWINRVYSFIHIPGTILFLVWLYNYTSPTLMPTPTLPPTPRTTALAGPRLFEARRRTMATCNLIAFIIFTIWPCMPPRLLSDPSVTGPTGNIARSYDFKDTVHGDGGEGSVWTQNQFCNQYAAMPSLHFGYSLLIGLTILTIPFPSHSSTGHKRVPSGDSINVSLKGLRITISYPRWTRVVCVVLGIAYPAIILVAILATANHFILDAVAGAFVCGIAWWGNGILLNLLVLEDWFLYLVGFCFAERGGEAVLEGEKEDNDFDNMGSF